HPCVTTQLPPAKHQLQYPGSRHRSEHRRQRGAPPNHPYRCFEFIWLRRNERLNRPASGQPMSVCIAGTGWVTPLGSGIQEVWNRLLAGDKASIQEISDPIGKRSYTTYRVPPTALKGLPPHPRLRRASAISRFAAAAGLAALQEAELRPDKNLAERTALV